MGKKLGSKSKTKSKTKPRSSSKPKTNSHPKLKREISGPALLPTPISRATQPSISVLVVEDVDEMRHLLDALLQEIEGVRVSGLASNSFEARIEVGRRRPDLILLDEILPGESGYDLLREFVELEIPVFLMTSIENPTHELPAGARLRLVKPGWKSLDEDRVRIKKLIFEHLKRSQA